MTQTTKNKLKAFFAAQALDVQDTGSEYSETYGYGVEGMSIARIVEVIDEFDEEAIS